MTGRFPSLSSSDTLLGRSRETLLFDNPAYLYNVTRPLARDDKDYFLVMMVAGTVAGAFRVLYIGNIRISSEANR